MRSSLPQGQAQAVPSRGLLPTHTQNTSSLHPIQVPPLKSSRSELDTPSPISQTYASLYSPTLWELPEYSILGIGLFYR